jgi:DNA-binding NarL/FixJ family response regulator
MRELEHARRVHAPRRQQAALTVREHDVLRLLTAGRDNPAIGQELYISSSTVKHHVASILDKLECRNRVQAAVEAVRIGLA